MRFVRWFGIFAAALICRAAAPAWDTSGNGMLNGAYYFREVIYGVGYSDGALGSADALYGTITFNGAGAYTMTATLLDAATPYLQQGTLSGTYAISASGYGYLSHPLITGASIFGSVGQQGIFVASATSTGYNDLFIAAPLASPSPTVASFKGSYTLAGLDLSGGSPLTNLGYLLQLNPDGAGNLGSPSVSGYEGQYGSQVFTQTLGTTHYIFSNGAAVVTFPNSSTAAIAGQEYLYFSADGNFVFGGSPQSFDMLVGVRAATGTPSFGGLYVQAGLDQDDSGLANGYGLLGSYYGSLNAGGGATIEHQRVFDALLSSAAIDLTYSNSYSLSSGANYSTPFMRYVVGADGIRIGSGIGPYLGINVAVPAAAPQPSSGAVFLNPTGVVNAGSFAPFTEPWVPGELLTLYGSNLAPHPLTVASQAPFPTMLDGVQVFVNNVAAPIYYTTPGQIAAIVPYAANTPVVEIQVVNNSAPSNVVTNFSGLTAPGVLTQSLNGLGYGDVEHADGSLVTPSHPAEAGETVAVYLTGLGAVYPAIPDGSAGPKSPLSQTTNTITAYIDSTSAANSLPATVTFAGLAPEVAGLYQVNLTIPSGATAGDNYLELAGPDSDTFLSLISIAGSPGATTSSTAAASSAPRLAFKSTRTPPSSPALPPARPPLAFGGWRGPGRGIAGPCLAAGGLRLRTVTQTPAAAGRTAHCQ